MEVSLSWPGGKLRSKKGVLSVPSPTHKARCIPGGIHALGVLPGATLVLPWLSSHV